MKPTALIFGHDGLDVDVAINLKHLYQDLGFRVVIAKQLHVADLLCVIRTPIRQNSDIFRYSQIHVFDYVCAENIEFLSSLVNHPKSTIFVPSIRRFNHNGDLNPALEEKMLVLLPPVFTKIWISKKIPKEHFNIVHVGNFKPYYENNTDVYANRFINQMANGSVKIWGKGWNKKILQSNIIKPAPLLKVSLIYKSASLALGMMYPFQRNYTISGRYWQAPLNGALLITEPNVVAEGIPGVVQSDYIQDLTKLTNLLNEDSRIQIKKSAKIFWDNHYRESIEIISRITSRHSGNSILCFLTLLRHLPRNLIRLILIRIRVK